MNSEEINFNKVLLLEDEEAHALLIKRAMRKVAGEVVHTTTLKGALDLLKTAAFDLIVSDLHLPDSQDASHLELLSAAARGRNNEIPVVVLTSSTSVNEAVSAMKEGASDFIVKNFDSGFEQILALSLQRVARSSRLSKERRKLQHEMAALRVAIENGSDGLAVVRGDGEVEYANSAFTEFAESSGGSGVRVSEFFGDAIKDHAKLGEDLEKHTKSLAAGAAWQTEVAFAASKDRAYGLSVSVIRDDATGREAVVWVKDISDQKRREKFQREILSTTTHDLKGPLGAIMISAELVGELIKDNKKASELVLRIASSAHGAVNLIDEFLSARRIQEGAFILRPTHQDLAALIEEVVSGFLPSSLARKLTMLQEGLPSLTGSVDRLAFQRVIGNLVTNAIKFTPPGGTITVRLSDAGAFAVIDVSDTGQGMEPSEVAKLFARFGRLEKHNEVAGSGLGLFVVRSIVTAHGGQVDVTSRIGAGTTFTIRVPKAPPVDERGQLIAV